MNSYRVQASIVAPTVEDLYALADETGGQRGMKGTEGSVTCGIATLRYCIVASASGWLHSAR